MDGVTKKKLEKVYSKRSSIKSIATSTKRKVENGTFE